jgi:hypothetical protein
MLAAIRTFAALPRDLMDAFGVLARSKFLELQGSSDPRTRRTGGR